MRTSPRAEVGRKLREACAIVYGIGYGMSTTELADYVCEHGLPSRAEREAILAARLAEGDEQGDNTLDVPAEVDPSEDQPPK